MDVRPYTLRWWMMMYQVALSRQLAYYEKGNDEQYSRYLKLADCIEFRIVGKYGEPDVEEMEEAFKEAYHCTNCGALIAEDCFCYDEPDDYDYWYNHED